MASTTKAVDLDWDYYEYRQGVDKNSRHERFPDPAEASGSMGKQPNKYQVARPVPHAGATQHQQLEEEEEEGIFFDANISLSPHHGAQGAQDDDPNIRYPSTGTLGPPLVPRPEGGQPLTHAPGLPALPPGASALDPGHNDQHRDQLGHDDQPGHIGDQPPDQPVISPIKTPVQQRVLQFPPQITVTRTRQGCKIWDCQGCRWRPMATKYLIIVKWGRQLHQVRKRNDPL